MDSAISYGDDCANTMIMQCNCMSTVKQLTKSTLTLMKLYGESVSTLFNLISRKYRSFCEYISVTL